MYSVPGPMGMWKMNILQWALRFTCEYCYTCIDFVDWHIVVSLKASVGKGHIKPAEHDNLEVICMWR